MTTLKTDVVVMGTGGAGLAAAIAATEGGAKVMMFEKRKAIGGISVVAMGIFAVESRLQRMMNVQFTRDDAFRLFMEHTHWRVDAKLVRAFIDKTASTIDWLEGMGVEFELLNQLTFPGGVNQTGHLVKAPTTGPGSNLSAHMIKIMRDKAKEKGIEIRTGTGVRQITKTGDMFTVTAEDSSGNTLQVEAKTVVVASGGYAHNKEMLAKDGFELGRDLNVAYDTIPLEGDGIRMAWALGAVSDGMCPMLTSYIPGQFFPFGKFPFTPEFMALVGLVGWSLPYLWVNQHGERFMDEGNGNGGYIANAMVRQKDKCFYAIFDGAIKRHIETDGPDVASYLLYVFGGARPDIDGLIRKALDNGMKGIFVADTLAELADKIGIPPTALQKNVDDYNRCCEKGYDDLFAKNPKFLQSVKEPRFYAFKQTPGAYGTVGGIKINERAEAMNKNDEAIPGLYAAGDCANGIHPPNFSLGYILWGNQLGFAINSGRIAGENAAEYVKSRCV